MDPNIDPSVCTCHSPPPPVPSLLPPPPPTSSLVAAPSVDQSLTGSPTELVSVNGRDEEAMTDAERRALRVRSLRIKRNLFELEQKRARRRMIVRSTIRNKSSVSPRDPLQGKNTTSAHQMLDQAKAHGHAGSTTRHASTLHGAMPYAFAAPIRKPTLQRSRRTARNKQTKRNTCCTLQ